MCSRLGKLAALVVASMVAFGLARTALAAGYASTVLDDEPIGYWRFGEMTPPTAFDSSPQLLNGAYVRNVAVGQPGALLTDPDTSALFNGIDGYVDVPSTPLVNQLVRDVTVEAWLKPEHLQGIDHILSTRLLVGGAGGFGWWRNGGRVGFSRWGVEAAQTSADILIADEWQHVVVVFDADDDTSFYLNGEFVELVAGVGGIDPNNQPLHIGKQVEWFASPEYWEGGIDELAIYPHSLTAEQVQEHYLAAVPEPEAWQLAAGLLPVLLLAALRRQGTRYHGVDSAPTCFAR